MRYDQHYKLMRLTRLHNSPLPEECEWTDYPVPTWIRLISCVDRNRFSPWSITLTSSPTWLLPVQML